ncbi:DUF3221 domain-containing protein [Halobacillus locisalis]|uniref:DUF3221 domain-containing protein n=1 Tax=Halobacillus locisalis TaxID=220753 RepID=A0A838CWW6_9BACI|nr:DUF3221 domain-containing protein [Halobacillus locisalis]MBA2176265.1 DUF3221 domain-containing protein [Halobacillus locisalis]
MKRYIGMILLLFVVACGQTENPGPTDTTSSEPKETDPSAEYDRIGKGCEESSFSGQTFADLSEEEQALYEIPEPFEGESLEDVQVAQMQMARYEYINESLESQGYAGGIEMIDSVGNFNFLKGSIVVQLKDGLKGEEKKRKEAIEKAVEDAQEYYNDQAVVVQEVPKTKDELIDHQNRLMSKLASKESLEKKIVSTGLCMEQSALDLVVREELSEEELQFINEQTDVDIKIMVQEPNKKTGYVTSSGDGRLSLATTSFQHSKEDIEIGELVTVSYETVMESYPAKSEAIDVKVHKPKQPEGADLNEKEVIQQSLEKVEDDSPHQAIKDITYHQQSDEWTVRIRLIKGMDESQVQDMAIKDE